MLWGSDKQKGTGFSASPFSLRKIWGTIWGIVKIFLKKSCNFYNNARNLRAMRLQIDWCGFLHRKNVSCIARIFAQATVPITG